MLSPLPPLHDERVLKHTTSRCPVCSLPCAAEVVQVGRNPGRVELRRLCATHGAATACLASDARFYWLSKGDPANADAACGCGASACRASDDGNAGTLGRNAAGRTSAGFESLATCLALIEVVDSCNLSCPTCYADSPVGTHSQVKAPPLEELVARISGIIERKGGIEILQLSGGEPTLHPKFFELLDWTLAHPRIDHVLLNTNGVLIARDDAFLDRLRAALRPGRLQLYLQFDGPQAAGQLELRGADLRDLRVRALERCAVIGLPVTLAMTVTPANLAHVGEALAFGLRWPHVRGITFQPEFRSGRSPIPRHLVGPGPGLPALPSPARLNTADIVLAAVEQSEGRLTTADFTPLPCGDPNCAIIGYLLRVQGAVRSVSEFIDFSQIQGFLRDRLQFRPEDLARCGCDSEPLGELLRRFELDATHTFRIVIKPFMDAWTWDQDRIDRCCTHVIRPDGRLDSFCRYYSGFPDTRVPA